MRKIKYIISSFLIVALTAVLIYIPDIVNTTTAKSKAEIKKISYATKSDELSVYEKVKLFCINSGRQMQNDYIDDGIAEYEEKFNYSKGVNQVGELPVDYKNMRSDAEYANNLKEIFNKIFYGTELSEICNFLIKELNHCDYSCVKKFTVYNNTIVTMNIITADLKDSDIRIRFDDESKLLIDFEYFSETRLFGIKNYKATDELFSMLSDYYSQYGFHDTDIFVQYAYEESYDNLCFGIYCTI